MGNKTHLKRQKMRKTLGNVLRINDSKVINFFVGKIRNTKVNFYYNYILTILWKEINFSIFNQLKKSLKGKVSKPSSAFFVRLETHFEFQFLFEFTNFFSSLSLYSYLPLNNLICQQREMILFVHFHVKIKYLFMNI